MAVYLEQPQDVIDFLNFAAFSDTLLSLTDTVPYVVALDTATYGWVAAFWKPVNQPILALRVGGWYTFNPSFGTPVPVGVAANTETDSINVVVDFNNLLTPDEAIDSLP